MAGVNRTRRRLRALPAALLVALAGCGITETEVPGAAYDLARGEALWDAAGPSSYDLLVEYHCYCPPTGVVRAEVRDGVLVATDPPGSTPPTVPELFDLIAEALRAQAAEVRVTYHATLGYPVQLWIDRSRLVADEEFGYEVTVVAPEASSG